MESLSRPSFKTPGCFTKSFDISHLDYPGEGKASWGSSGSPCLRGDCEAVGLHGEVWAEQEAVAVRWMVTEGLQLW